VFYGAVTPELVRGAHLRDLRCSTWTVNGRADVRRVAACGVDAITSDYPDRVRRWLPQGRS
jgi:glycerophosphoryl diester phosphodiesterase